MYDVTATLVFITAFFDQHGYAPTVREICGGTGIKSTSTVHRHIKELQEKGLIHRNGLSPRALEIR